MDEFCARDLAWQLATDQLPIGSPLALQKELEYQGYFYYLIDANTAKRHFLGLVVSCLTLRLKAGIRLMRNQKHVLHLASNDFVNTQTMLEAIGVEQESRSRYWLGTGSNMRSRCIFDSINDQSLKFEFASHIRNRRLLETPDGIRAPNFRLQILGATLIGLAVFSWLTVFLYAMNMYTQTSFIFVSSYLIVSIVLASWITLEFVTYAKKKQSVAKRANAALSPRMLYSTKIS